ncbi:MAG: hypothetical protein HRU28_10230 [Rhizobiales bacterium]|nr:hypothetical protein [Hyphomicrobiales bacterium]
MIEIIHDSKPSPFSPRLAIRQASINAHWYINNPNYTPTLKDIEGFKAALLQIERTKNNIKDIITILEVHYKLTQYAQPIYNFEGDDKLDWSD